MAYKNGLVDGPGDAVSHASLLTRLTAGLAAMPSQAALASAGSAASLLPLAAAAPVPLSTRLVACLQYGSVRCAARRLGRGGEARRRRAARSTFTLPPHPLLVAAFCSVAITLFNRAVFSFYDFNFPAVVTLLQASRALRRAASQLQQRSARQLPPPLPQPPANRPPVSTARRMASLSTTHPPTPQVLVSLAACYALRAAGRMRFGPLTWRGARRAAPLAACWWLYVVSGVTALRYLNVPMYR